MKRIARLFLPLIMTIGLLAVLAAYAIVVNDLPSRIYTPVQQEWLSYNLGRIITQDAPELNFISPEGALLPAVLIGDDQTVRATLIGRHEEQDGVSATVYDLDFRGEYHLAHSDSPAALFEWFFPFPANLETLHDVRFLVDDVEPDGVDYSTRGIRWQTWLEPNEEHRVVISYRAEGANSFSYSLPRERRINVDLKVTVVGLLGSQSAQGHLRPTLGQEVENSELFVWNYQNLIADRDIQLTLPVQLSFAQRVAQLQDDFQALAQMAPLLVLSFLLALLALFHLNKIRLQPETYLLAGFGLALFYPLLTFLSGLVDVTVAATLAILLVSGLLSAFLGRAAGWRRAGWRAGLLLLVFLGFFSLGMITPWRGLSLTLGGILLATLFMASLTQRSAEPEPTPQLVDEATNVEPESSQDGVAQADAAAPVPEAPAGETTPELAAEEAEEPEPEPAGLYCPFCACRLADDHRFCPACGHETDQIGACSSCGRKQFIPAGQTTVHSLCCGVPIRQASE